MDLTSHSYVGLDGVRLTFHLRGLSARPPLVCVPGGPMLDTDYLGDLGGLYADRPLALLDLRGTGASGGADDAASCRCDRLVDDLQALRQHLGHERLDLLGHSAGANVVYRYAERHPDHVGRLLLVTPSVRALALDVADQERRAVAQLRAGQPWYEEAMAALEDVWADIATDEQYALLEPFSHARWDEATRSYVGRMDQRRDPRLAQAFGAEGAFNPPTTRDALGRLDVPVLVLAGAWDVGVPPALAAQVVGLFPRADLVVQPEAGHFPLERRLSGVPAPSRGFRQLIARLERGLPGQPCDVPTKGPGRHNQRRVGKNWFESYPQRVDNVGREGPEPAHAGG